MIAANDPNRGWSLGTNDPAGKMPQEVYRLHRQGRSTPCTSVMRTTSVASEANLKPGNRKGTNPGPPNCSGRTRRIVLVLRTPPRVLSSTAATCGPPFGTKRPQVQILSPQPVPQVSDLHECRAPRRYPPLGTRDRRREGTKEHKGPPGKAMIGSGREKKTRRQGRTRRSRAVSRHGAAGCHRPCWVSAWSTPNAVRLTNGLLCR